MNITIQFYGAFRKLGSSQRITCESPSSIAQIKSVLSSVLGEGHKALIKDSVMANDTDILPNDYILMKDCTLSILPPVCGG